MLTVKSFQQIKTFEIKKNFLKKTKPEILLKFNLKKRNIEIKNVTCCLDNTKNILNKMPEAFVADFKRPDFVSLSVLQRIGKLDITKENQNLSKTYYSEINHEFRFLSVEKAPVSTKKSLSITLGLNKEDNLLTSQSSNTVKFVDENNSKLLSVNKEKNQDKPEIETKIFFTKISILNLNYFKKLIYSLILFGISLLSML